MPGSLMGTRLRAHWRPPGNTAGVPASNTALCCRRAPLRIPAPRTGMTMWRRVAIACGVFVLVAAGLVWLGHVPLSSDHLRRRIVTSLGRTFQSKVDLDAVEL